MEINLPITIQPQPDDTTCGPTCLHAIYNYFNENISLGKLIEETKSLEQEELGLFFWSMSLCARGIEQ